MPKKPGNIIIRSGRVTAGTKVAGARSCGDIVFELGDGTECLRFEEGGVVKVRGEVVEKNGVVWDRLKEWLLDAKILMPKDFS